MGYRVHTLLAGRRHADRPGGRPRDHRGLRRPRRGARLRAAAWTSSLSSSRTSRPTRRRPRPSSCPCGRQLRPAHHAAPAAREELSRPCTAFPVTPSAAVRTLDGSRRRAAAARHARRVKTAGVRLRRQGPAHDRRRPTTPTRVWPLSADQDAMLEALRGVRARGLGRRRARPRRRLRPLRRGREHAPNHILDLYDRAGAASRRAGAARRWRSRAAMIEELDWSACSASSSS